MQDTGDAAVNKTLSREAHMLASEPEIKIITQVANRERHCGLWRKRGVF